MNHLTLYKVDLSDPETLDEAFLSLGSVYAQGICVCPPGPCLCNCVVERKSS